MSIPDEQVEQTAKRLAEVEALQQTLSAVQQELRAYQDLLAQKLVLLRAGSQAAVVLPAADDEVIVPVADEDWGDLPQAASAPPVPKPPLPPVVAAKPAKSMSAPPISRPAKGIPPAPPAPAKGTPVPSKQAKGVPGRAAAAPPLRSAGKETINTKAPLAQAEPAGGPRGERRSAPRRGGNPISVQISQGEAGSDTFQGWVVDRSSGGVRLLVDQAVDAGTVLSLRPTKAHPSLGWVQVRVKSCRPDRNSFKIGCQFVNKLSWAELQVFG